MELDTSTFADFETEYDEICFEHEVATAGLEAARTCNINRKVLENMLENTLEREKKLIEMVENGKR